GIHGRHLAGFDRIRYISTDPKRQTIPVVYYTDDAGKTTQYVSTDIQTTPQQLQAGEQRSMDCVDCHNRPTHAFEMPESAVDRRMQQGLISAELPYIKKTAIGLLKADYSDRDTAKQRIEHEVNRFYQTNYADVYQTRRALVQQSAENVAEI